MALSDALAGVFDAILEPIVLVDALGSIAFVNREGSSLSGYAAGEIEGRPVETLLPMDMREPHARYRQEFVDSDQTRPRAGRVLVALRKDGETLPVEVGLGHFYDGSTRYAVAVIRDLTERRLTMLGFDPHRPEPTIELWLSLVHPEDLPSLRQRFDEAIGNPAARQFELEIRARHSDGRSLWILIKGTVVAREAGSNSPHIAGTLHSRGRPWNHDLRQPRVRSDVWLPARGGCQDRGLVAALLSGPGLPAIGDSQVGRAKRIVSAHGQAIGAVRGVHAL